MNDQTESVSVPVRRCHPDAKLPQRGSTHAAGWDLHAVELVTLQPGERCLVATGLAVALPAGTEMQIRPRSGLAHRHGVTVLNAPGTIDADYRGEIKVMLINHGREAFRIEAGHRIAQAVVARHLTTAYTWVECLPETARGAGGFGHTGVVALSESNEDLPSHGDG